MKLNKFCAPIRGRNLFALAAILAVTLPVQASQVYFNDFESGADASWSDTSIFVTPSGRSTLGAFANQVVTLTLGGLASHTSVTIVFDLFTNRTWDGNGEGCCGVDVWDLGIQGGPTLLHTTFANGGGPGELNTQSYPGNYPADHFAPLTGATENPYLGTGTDFVYHLSFTVPHTAGSILFDFSGSGLQGVDDENWSLDNVSVGLDAVPEPTQMSLLLAAGLVALVVRRYRPGSLQKTTAETQPGSHQ